MSDETFKKFEDALHDHIQDEVQQTVTRFVLSIRTNSLDLMDQNRCAYITLGAPDQTLDESLGLLTYALTRLKAEAAFELEEE